jgi:hypothetical protein
MSSTASSASAQLSFAERVDFTAKSGIAKMMSAKGTLLTRASGKSITMRLSNLSVAGATDTVELITIVDAKTLVLERSQAFDMAKDVVLREMKKKVDKSVLDGQMTDIFEFREYSNDAVTTTEPFIEYRVADFLSLMLIAADAIERGDLKQQDVSVYRDRSVNRAVMTFSADPQGNGRTAVKVAPPDNPDGGLTYVIAKSPMGRYYPAEIRVNSDSGAVELIGVPQ